MQIVVVLGYYLYRIVSINSIENIDRNSIPICSKMSSADEVWSIECSDDEIDKKFSENTAGLC